MAGHVVHFLGVGSGRSDDTDWTRDQLRDAHAETYEDYERGHLELLAVRFRWICGDNRERKSADGNYCSQCTFHSGSDPCRLYPAFCGKVLRYAGHFISASDGTWISAAGRAFKLAD